MKNLKTFKKFEFDVMCKILNRKQNYFNILFNQYNNSIIKKREFSKTGFFTSFTIDKNFPTIDEKSYFHVGDVIAKVNNNDDIIGFVLFIKNGYIDMLEGYTFGESLFPEKIENYSLEYLKENSTDISIT